VFDSAQKVEDKPSPAPYMVQFDVANIISIRRSDPKLAWSYVLFTMKDGRSQPALHFHSGGIDEMISMLQRYIWLTRYATESKQCFPKIQTPFISFIG